MGRRFSFDRPGTAGETLRVLEDDFTYVLRKALAGHGLSPAEAARRAGLEESRVMALIRGDFDAAVAATLAPVLGLNPAACAGHPGHAPQPCRLGGIRRLELPFEDGLVNVWLLGDGAQRVMIDTGFGAGDAFGALGSQGLPVPERVFITHAHRDHVGGLEDALKRGLPVHADGVPGTIPMKAGDAVLCGPLVIRAVDLSGHANPTLGFVVQGLERPVLVTGDALFAGSIGGCPSPALYRHALSRIRAEMAGLADDTVLLPGHGPATSLGEERRGNPFL